MYKSVNRWSENEFEFLRSRDITKRVELFSALGHLLMFMKIANDDLQFVCVLDALSKKLSNF